MKKLLILLLVLFTVPFVYADINIACSATTIEIDKTVTCDVKLAPAVSSISSVAFTIDSGSYLSIVSVGNFPQDFSGLFNPDNNKVLITTPQLKKNPTTLATITLKGKAEGSAPVKITVSEFLDDNFDVVDYGNANPSQAISVSKVSDECKQDQVVVCTTDKLGVCSKGEKGCVSGKWGACVQKMQVSSEVCDGKDNDCDGNTDEGFDLKTDPANCGSCGKACNPKETCQSGSCTPPAPQCADNDKDGFNEYSSQNCPNGNDCNDNNPQVTVCLQNQNCESGVCKEKVVSNVDTLLTDIKTALTNDQQYPTKLSKLAKIASLLKEYFK